MQIQSLTLSTKMTNSPTCDGARHTRSWRLPTPTSTIPFSVSILIGLVKLLASNRHHDLPNPFTNSAWCSRSSKRRPTAFITAERNGGCGGWGNSAFVRTSASLHGVRNRLAMGTDLARRTGCETDHQRRMGGMLEIRPPSPSVRPPVPINGAELDVNALMLAIEDPCEVVHVRSLCHCNAASRTGQHHGLRTAF